MSPTKKAPRKRKSLAESGSASTLDAWLERVGFGRYAALFRRHCVDLDVLPELTEADLEKLGIPLGHRKKLLKAVASRAQADPVPEHALTGSHAPAPPVAAERRQLTVMFCDLVGYTALSARVDPEDLRQVVLAYQESCKGVIEGFGGQVAQYLGDGVLAFFGYPQAMERGPERAVRAALDIVGAMPELRERLGVPLQTRIGIETGHVVIGDLSGSASATGSTPNLAARLQVLAEPDTAVVGPTTRALTQGLFEYADLGRHSLKGFLDPVPVWRVVGLGLSASRFEALRDRGAMAPLVGRRHELSKLLGCWRQAASGKGGVVLVKGEPGIGKSRLVQALKEAVAGEGETGTPTVGLRGRARLIEYSCAPYFRDTPFHPVIDHLQRSLRIGPTDPPSEKLRRVEEAFGGSKPRASEIVGLFASLLSVPLDDRYPALRLSPQILRERTLEALVAWLLREARRQPVLLAVEDLQWADASTLALLELLSDRGPNARMLVVLAVRTDFEPPWDGSRSYTEIRLERLTQDQVAAVVDRLTGGKPLPAEVLDQFLGKTDGVPLFVEELVKAVLESGLVREENGRYVLAKRQTSLAIPASLQDTLMARLDRLGAAKPVAQLAATIGRQFSRRLLGALWQGERADLDSALTRLMDAGLVYRTARQPDPGYEFKHALIQDAAYESLLKGTRREYHQRIAKALERRFPEVLETQPGLVAHHLSSGGLPEEAIPYWLRAAETALQRSANLEAIARLEAGLSAAGRLPEGVVRTRHELDLLLALGSALTVHKGVGHHEVEAAYRRAQGLWQQLEDKGKATLARCGLWVHYGLWAHYHVRGDHRTAQPLAKDVLALAQRHSDRVMRLVGHTAEGCSRLYRGDFAGSLDHLEQALGLYRFDEDRSMFLRTAHDLGVVCLTYSAQALWILGFPDRALARARQALNLAQQDPPHPYGVSLALTYLVEVHLMRGETEEARACAEKGIAVSREQGIPLLVAASKTACGLARSMEPGSEDAIEQMRRGIEDYRATGSRLVISRCLSSLAEAYGRSGQLQLGLDSVAEALALAEETGEHLWEAEDYRVKGDLLLRSDGQATLGEACLQRAIAIARKQGARSMELRAALSLGRWWHAQGKAAPARALLSPVYQWFTEGFETMDLQDARHLLGELDSNRRTRRSPT